MSVVATDPSKQHRPRPTLRTQTREKQPIGTHLLQTRFRGTAPSTSRPGEDRFRRSRRPQRCYSPVWKVTTSRLVLPAENTGVFLPPIVKSCCTCPLLRTENVTVPGRE